MRGRWCLLAIVLACPPAAAVSAGQAPVNPAAARLVNPVPPTPESLAAGQRHYQRLCRACHHASGNGKGPYGIARGIRPSDFTDTRWDFGSTDGEIFTAIRNGIESAELERAAHQPAPGGPSLDHAYEGRLSDADIWSVVNHLRTFSRPGSR